MMKKSTLTKKRIIEAALEIVGEKGHSASTTREIAEEAGVSEATLFKYFGSKDELLKEIVLQTMDNFYNYAIAEALPQILNDSQGHSVEFLLTEFATERMTFLQKHSKAFRVIFQEMMINESVFKMFREKIWVKMQEITDFIFDQGKKSGELRQIDNYFLRKTFISTIIFAGIFENILQLDQDQPYNLKEQVSMILDILFNGIKEE